MSDQSLDNLRGYTALTGVTPPPSYVSEEPDSEDQDGPITQWRRNSTSDPVFESIVDDEEYTEGDCEVITADGVRFWVSYQDILAFSDRARKRYEAFIVEHGSTPDLIVCVNTKIETAEAFRKFLNLAINKYVCPDSYYALNCADLAMFLVEWECPSLTEEYCKQVSAILETFTTFSPINAFLIGALLDNEELCRAALRSRDWWYTDTLETPNGVVEVNVLDPGFIPWDIIIDLPSRYHFALVHAWSRVGDSAQLPDEFSTRLAIARRYT